MPLKNYERNSGRVESVMPYGGGKEKTEQVEQMFDSIAPAYDLMNTAMTFGLHKRWREKALTALARLLADRDPEMRILDVATGTGDVAFRMAEIFPRAEITGIDLSDGMLDVARKKLEAIPVSRRPLIQFLKADCLQLPFADDSFAAVTVAYGVRNFARLPEGYREMFRVLRPGGMLCVIELSEPRNRTLHSLYRLYSGRIIPSLGRMVSGDSSAYTYLPQSIAAAPQREDMTRLMSEAGFSQTAFRSLTFGVVTVYMARKPI